METMVAIIIVSGMFALPAAGLIITMMIEWFDERTAEKNFRPGVNRR